MSWLWFIIIGAVAGWLAGNIMRGGGFGLLVNIIVGIIGALIGGWVFRLLSIDLGNYTDWKPYYCIGRSNFALVDNLAV